MASRRLVLFPCAGAGPMSYFRWRTLVPADVELLAVQLPGREDRADEAPHHDLAALLAELVPALQPHCALPTVFLGHSLGALVAYEAACALHRASQPSGLRGLVLAGRRAARVPATSQLHALPPTALLAEVAQRFGGLEGIDLNSDIAVAHFATVLRADLAVHETYRRPADRAPLPLPIIACAGAEDHEASAELMTPWLDDGNAASRLEVFPGGHFFVHAHAERLLRLVSALFE